MSDHEAGRGRVPEQRGGPGRMTESGAELVLGGRYRLEDRIASGGMGTVWSARDETLNRPVALKILNEAFADDERFIERFRREAKAAAGLVHPNVAGVFDYGEDGGRPYIVMELIDGDTLAQLVEDRGPFPPDEVARIGADVAATLALAHERGIVHRDVKPANVMLTRRGEVKVMDFGIAAEILAGATSLTGTGMVLGTARYLSPEQARGERATPRSDVYSLGVVLYELLAGRAPFVRPTPMATAMAHMNDPAPPLADARPAIPADLAGIVDRCLAKDPADRPASAGALAAELRGVAPAALDADTAVLPAGAPTDELAETGPPPDAAPTAPIRRRTTRPAGGLTAVWTRADPRRRVLALGVAVAILVAVILALVLRSGTVPVAVPRFVGKPKAVAVRTAHHLGLHVRVVRRASPRPIGVVVEQFPPRGTVVDRSDPVILAVSSGPTTGTGSSPPPPPAGHGKGKGHGHGKAKGHGKGPGEGD
jgi:predicted Ser/Thr protein kinase